MTQNQATPRLEISPSSFLIDQDVSIRVVGMPPGYRAKISLSTTDDEGIGWMSWATYRSGGDGAIDVSGQAPVNGTYAGVDPMGLFWSMKPTESPRKSGPFTRTGLDPETITASVDDRGKLLASAKMTRFHAGPGVARQEVEGENLRGVFFWMDEGEARPGVIVLGGSDGSIREDFAALLATHGFAALALAYFDQDGLPQELVEVPLEIVETGIEWMEENGAVQAGKLAVLGKSKGGELALLAASTFDNIKAAVIYVGSGVVFQGISKDPRNPKVASSWTYQGKPLPYVPLKWNRAEIARAILLGILGRPLSMVSIYERNMKDEDAVEKALIPVGNIKGPVLLISGKHDRVWPSSSLSNDVMRRLGRLERPYPDRHLQYENAGHRIGIPNLPTTVDFLPLAPGRSLRFGGSPYANAGASSDSWKRALEFLQGELG